jgi:SAM-dependent methyltransferase
VTSWNSTERFSDRADAYVRARPTYPDAVVAHLELVGALAAGAAVVDLGVGTGLSAEPFLRAGYAVIGVEPNDAMRESGDRFLAAWPRYRSVKGTAEATGLPAHCAQLAIAGQAFHWFDPPRARAEALRILVPGGWAALMWNDRVVTGDAFAEGYERLCHRFGRDYDKIRTRHVDSAALARFFSRVPALAEFTHVRRLDFETMAALAASASYMPAPGSAQYAPLMRALRELFDAHAGDGMIALRYRLRVHCARLA